MKVRYSTPTLGLLVVAAMLSACGSSSAPKPPTSEPGLQVGPGKPSASNATQTETSTNSGTSTGSTIETATETATVTATETYTSTLSGTDTASDTSTNSDTSTTIDLPVILDQGTPPDCRFVTYTDLTQPLTDDSAAANPALKATAPSYQIWCKREYTASRETLYFMVPYPAPAIPELGRIVRRDSSGQPISLVRARTYQGRLEVFEAPYNTSWLPQNFESKPKTDNKPGWVSNVTRQADSIYTTLKHSGGKSLATPVTVKSGNISGRVTDAAYPWRGYWWPWQGTPIAAGQNSPLAKYARFHEAHTGQRVQAQEWEHVNHAQDIEWGGHCNGWAAASQIYAEPRTSVKDPVTGIRFSVTEQKALLAETGYSVYHHFIGERFEKFPYPNGKPRDPKDVAPHVFFRTLIETLGYEGRPLAVDYDATERVDNHLMVSYNGSVTRVEGSDRTFDVIISVNMFPYDKTIVESLGPPTAYPFTYAFSLVTDEAGRPIGGEWKSENPDFLWIPLAPMQEGGNARENPWVKDTLVDKILRLPQG